MVERAVLHKEIDRLPPQYFGEVFDFVGYLLQKAQKASVQQKTGQPGLTEEQKARERECFIRNADELNREMAEILLDQSSDI